MTSEVRFLTLEEVIHIHLDGIEEAGGSPGLRDSGLVESAVHAARNVHEYEGADLALIAAAYLYSLCKNHGFVDGNKRVALRAADVFLAVNGYELTLSNDEAYEATIKVATSECSRDELAEIIRNATRPLL